ncbi:HutD/Ves family protein [Terrarubrum flagellatum]|uniref:HutD/Ves family protein n=1 Tax=Terrirubrum flagellatum TaxID=2895980 RepID=UPI00314538E1
MKSSAPTLTAIDPSTYRRTPWKNGGGVTIDIAGEQRVGVEGWSGVIWRFGRTSIVEPAPFSDLRGYDRLQVVIAGRGLSLQTPDGEIDMRVPFRPARFSGDTPIVSRLDDGPVEVVNLIADRRMVAIALAVMDAGKELTFTSGQHVAYAPGDPAEFIIDDRVVSLRPDHALRIEAQKPMRLCGGRGVFLVASIRSA